MEGRDHKGESIYRQTDRHTDSQTDRKTQTDRQTDRQTNYLMLKGLSLKYLDPTTRKPERGMTQARQ